MAIGVYLTYKILDIADLTVDGSLATGGAVAALCIRMGVNPWLALLIATAAGMLAGLVTGLLLSLIHIWYTLLRETRPHRRMWNQTAAAWLKRAMTLKTAKFSDTDFRSKMCIRDSFRSPHSL